MAVDSSRKSVIAALIGNTIVAIFKFIAFFLVVFAVVWSLRSNTARKVWLLVCSYVFYMAWDWRFLGLIIASTLIEVTTDVGIGGLGSVSNHFSVVQGSLELFSEHLIGEWALEFAVRRGACATTPIASWCS